MAITLAILLVLFITPKAASKTIEKSVIIEPEKEFSIESNVAVPSKEKSTSAFEKTKKFIKKSKKIKFKSLSTKHKTTSPKNTTINISTNETQLIVFVVNDKINNKSCETTLAVDPLTGLTDRGIFNEENKNKEEDS